MIPEKNVSVKENVKVILQKYNNCVFGLKKRILYFILKASALLPSFDTVATRNLR
jgi:hypothetical protein